MCSACCCELCKMYSACCSVLCKVFTCCYNMLGKMYSACCCVLCKVFTCCYNMLGKMYSACCCVLCKVFTCCYNMLGKMYSACCCVLCKVFTCCYNMLGKMYSACCCVLQEVFIPVLLVVAMILISLGVDTDVTPAVSEFPSHNLSMAAFAPPLSKPFLVSPDLHFTHDVMDQVTRAFNTSSTGYVVSNDDVTSSEMDEEYLEKPEMAEVGVELLWRNTSEGVAVEGYVLRVPHELVKDVLPGCGFRKSMREYISIPLFFPCPGVGLFI